MQIIGLIGSRGAGKTTAYNIISRLMPTNEIMIARKLKTVCADILCIPESDLNDPAVKEIPFAEPHILTTIDLEYILRKFDIYGHLPMAVAKHAGRGLKSPRDAAQYVGTEVVRDIDHQIHMKTAMRDAMDGILNVVTDIRFLNEYLAFSDAYPDFELWYIKRDVAESNAAADTHPSERGINLLRRYANRVIENNGTIAGLQSAIRTAFTIPLR